MPKSMRFQSKAKYSLKPSGCFVIENYNESKPFSNFFPGIAGLWGIPMWVFYVNRGQCIASFGIEAKNKAIMEFQPANKSYRLTSLHGFRTFIKAKAKGQTYYWEPFQNHIQGTGFKKKQKMSITTHDLTIEEINFSLGLTVKVNYFTLPEEPFSALIRQVSIKNNSSKNYDINLIDGLPMIVPYGLRDDLIKNLSRTVEAWVKVRNMQNNAPYYQLDVEVSDKPKVTHIKEGNFFFSFDPKLDSNKPLSPIVDATSLFGPACDFLAPENFLNRDFSVPEVQNTSNRTPSAMSLHQFSLKSKEEREVFSLYGYARSLQQLNGILGKVTAKGFVNQKAKQNKAIIEEIKNCALTKSSSDKFDLYAANTFHDNVLRGGLPISLKTSDGNVTFNVYSRKHGDLERDYNYFTIAPTFYTQGNGNYRDVNQNRRNDVWFNGDVKDSQLVCFLNLIQADGYNPLVVKGTTFSVNDQLNLNKLLDQCVASNDKEALLEFLNVSFLPGALLEFIDSNEINLKVSKKEFLGQLLEICHKQELAEHGEGFWTDHWTYNLDLIERYLALYPEELENLLIENKIFTFYHNSHYILPRDTRYHLTSSGVRQYKSVIFDEQINVNGSILREKNGEGAVYSTNLICKLLCLIANKTASLDPSGIGVEMEADKPNWYDALNGLPGLLGSSVSETLEIKRLSIFLLESIKKLKLDENLKLPIFEELSNFISGLSNILSLESDSLSYWHKANDIKEHYRNCVREGIGGEEKNISVVEIKNFLSLVIDKMDQALDLAKDHKGFLSTYFYHEATKYESLDAHQDDSNSFVKPLQFTRHDLPPFLEGYVHALRVCSNKDEAKVIYSNVKKSDLYDKKLKMYKVNADLSNESEEIGRARIFPNGWLENESVWLHMEYKYLLELLRNELFDEFYEDFQNVLIPFLRPQAYGRSILENSSFIVSSAHEDSDLHGRGFVARLSGSTAEFIHVWLLMNVGASPFELNVKNELTLRFKPALAGWLFTNKKSKVEFKGFSNVWRKIELPKSVYAFNFLGSVLVVYHNPKHLDTFGNKKAVIKKIELTYPNHKRPHVISSPIIPAPYAQDIRDLKVDRIDVHFS